jgi:hypothetical protein
MASRSISISYELTDSEQIEKLSGIAKELKYRSLSSLIIEILLSFIESYEKIKHGLDIGPGRPAQWIITFPGAKEYDDEKIP